MGYEQNATLFEKESSPPTWLFLIRSPYFSGISILHSTTRYPSQKHLFLLINCILKNSPSFPSAWGTEVCFCPAGKLHKAPPYIFPKVLAKSLTTCLIWIHPEAISNWQWLGFYHRLRTFLNFSEHFSGWKNCFEVSMFLLNYAWKLSSSFFHSTPLILS